MIKECLDELNTLCYSLGKEDYIVSIKYRKAQRQNVYDKC